MSTTAIKLGSLAVRTLAKPIANRIKSQAREHPRFRELCIALAQRLHRVDMQLRIGLLRDTSANLEKHEQAEKARRQAEAFKKIKEGEAIFPSATGQVRSDVPAPDGEAVKYDEEKKPEKKQAPRIRPLSESKAVDAGATFISEAFLFAVAMSLILLEQLRSRRKEANRRDVVQERLELLEDRNRQDEERLMELELRGKRLEERVEQLEDEVWRLSGRKGGRPKRESEMYKTWEVKPLWVEEKRRDKSWWGSVWEWGGAKQDESVEVKAEKVEASKREVVLVQIDHGATKK